MMADLSTYMQEYSQLDADVVRFADSGLENLSLDTVPKEAFKDPSVLVNAFMDDSFTEKVILFHDMDDPMVINQYLYDNAEEICSVLDTMATKESKDFTIEDIVENPKQVVYDVYAEEATNLIANTYFYTNQGMSEEVGNNQLNREDINVIRSCITNAPYHIRQDEIIRFDGLDDGKPYVVEFEYAKASQKIDELFKEDYQKDVNLTSHRILDKTANDFRVIGPTAALQDFKLQFEYLAKDYEKGKDEISQSIANDVRSWNNEQSMLFFHTTRAGGFKFLDKSNEQERNRLRVRDKDKQQEQSMERTR